MNTFPPFFEGLFEKQFGSWFMVTAMHNEGADLYSLALDVDDGRSSATFLIGD